jgi:hypothetical protein
VDGRGGVETLLRATCYLCMTPAAWASPTVLRQRQLGFEHNLTTSHWPHEWVPIGGPVPHLPRNNPRRLSAAQRALIGYDRGVDETSSSEQGSTWRFRWRAERQACSETHPMIF